MKRITIFCAAGMSTSLLVKKMEEAAKKNNFDCKISAYSSTKIREFGPTSDIILLAPQIRFQKTEVEELCPNVPLLVINMMDYGMMNGEKIISQIINVLK